MSLFNLPKGFHCKVATHFLCFPLYNTRSSLQLQNLVQRLRDDEQTVGCPQKAFRLPKSLSLPIVYFKFGTQHDLDVALEFLRSLDVCRMLRHAANISTHHGTSVKVTGAADDLTGQVSPLSVSLSGLHSRRKNPAEENVWRVYSVPVDTTNRLQLLSIQILEDAVSARLEAMVSEMNFLRPQFLDSRRGRTKQIIVDEDGQRVEKHLQSGYELRYLIDKYKDIVLAENIPLEKLSLCRNGRVATFQGANKEILIDEFYEEIESISLPL